MKKSVVAVILVLIMLVSLAACQKNGGGTRNVITGAGAVISGGTVIGRVGRDGH